MKIDELNAIAKCLAVLAKHPSILALDIARNLNRLNPIIVQAEKDFKDSLEPFYIMGEDGKPVKYVLDTKTKRIVQEGEGENKVDKVFVDQKTTPLGPTENTCFKFADPKKAEELGVRYNEAEHNFEFIPFNPDDLQSALKGGKIQAELLTPLIGNIIPA